MEERKKRVRAPNFSTEEVRLLLKLALNEKNILENKKTDSEAWRLKNEAWRKITENFNATSGQTFRSVDTLRQKYDGMKKCLKKKVNKNKAETMKTGGGKPEYIVIDGPEKELLEILSVGISGLPSAYDSDRLLPQTTVTGEWPSDKNETVIESTNIDSQATSQTTTEILNGVLEPECEMENSEENLQRNGNFSANNLNEDEENLCIVVEDNCEKAEIRTPSWKSWSPAMLKTKKHTALRTPKKSGKLILNKKLDHILEMRQELLAQQIKQSKEEERRAEEKHVKEMKLLEINILLKSRELENKI